MDIAKTYKEVFALEKEPIIKGFCCLGDICVSNILSEAQDELDQGNPIVLELLGRPEKSKDSRLILNLENFSFHFDPDPKTYEVTAVFAFVPGQKIPKDFLRAVMARLERENFQK